MTNPYPGILSGHRILVVEDECLIALDLQSILERWGCTVLGPVSTVERALQIVRDDTPDAAVLDVNLCSETTEPIAAALRALDRPSVVLSAYQAHHLTGALVGLPLLNKPVDERKLLLELSSLLLDVVPLQRRAGQQPHGG